MTDYSLFNLEYKPNAGYYINTVYSAEFEQLGMADIDAVFNFSDGQNLHKNNLSCHRSRLKIELPISDRTIYLKKYIKTPVSVQIKKWLCHFKIKPMAYFDFYCCDELKRAGVRTPHIAAFGYEQFICFERRSFSACLEVEGKSLEQRFPQFNCRPDKINFINDLANFAAKFHKTGFRHRDFYLCHIFYDDKKEFALIDLHRVFKPIMFSKRYLVKDLSQLYYSANAQTASKTDRMRFFKKYKNIKKLSPSDKRIIHKINTRAKKMALHDKKHNRQAGYYI